MSYTNGQSDWKTKYILRELRIPVHRAGYKQLMCAIQKFAQDDQQLLSCEIYPYVADLLHYTDGRAVEHAIRTVIQSTWKSGSKPAWEKYFPGCTRAPTNKLFIATIAELIK